MQLNYQSREERSLKSNLYLNAKSLTTYASQMWNDCDSINQFEIVYMLPQWFNNVYLRTRWSITWLCFKTKFSKLIILTLKRFLIELVSGLSSKMPVQKRSNFRDTGTGSDVSLWKCFFFWKIRLPKLHSPHFWILRGQRRTRWSSKLFEAGHTRLFNILRRKVFTWVFISRGLASSPSKKKMSERKVSRTLTPSSTSYVTTNHSQLFKAKFLFTALPVWLGTSPAVNVYRKIIIRTS